MIIIKNGWKAFQFPIGISYDALFEFPGTSNKASNQN
jgi:hypothetical protein